MSGGEPRSATPRRWWTVPDRVITFLLFLMLGFGAVALFQVGWIVIFPADVCGGDGYRCDHAVIMTGGRIASWGPLALLLAAIVLAVVRLHRGRIASFVPLAGMAGTVGVFVLGAAVVDAAITRG